MSNLSLFHKIAESSAPKRIGIFIIILLLVWIPLAIPIYLLVEDVNLKSIWAIALLYIEFIILVKIWGKKIYQQSHLLHSYGLIINRLNFQLFFQGLGIGLFSIFSLFILEIFLGLAVWHSPSEKLLQFVFEVLWVSSIVYAVLHFIKPIKEIWRNCLQFPGLVLLGLILVWAKRSTRKKLNQFTPKKQELLGLPIGIHAGLVWGYYIINVGSLVKYHYNTREWLVGIDGNPFTGLIGFFFLAVIALWIGSKN